MVVSAEQPDRTYQLLRHLTTPVAAVTTSAAGRRNGQIVNSAQRASLVPHLPRISLYISKTNFSHDLLYASGLFGVHLLRNDQWDVVRALGLRSGRDIEDKFESLETRTGTTGIPMLTDVLAGFECRVVNAMDAGAATFFLGDVVDVRSGASGDVMTSTHFRAHAPADLLAEYEARLLQAQSQLARIASVAGEWGG
ncbi:MAG TPA: flavin reductase family protein, partial [Longimicrobiales bacterium]|nr:flavin reductase family protein [Longimicrobiales bacterium]